MAAQVEVQPGDLGMTAARGRLHLSPLTDASNNGRSEIPSINPSHVITSEPNKPVPAPKPRLSPKPFSVEKNPSIKPILAPKPQTKSRPESTRLPGQTTDHLSTQNTSQYFSAGTPRLVSTIPNRPSPTFFNTSTKVNTQQTIKPGAQQFKPAPPLDSGGPSKPSPGLLRYSKSFKRFPVAEWSGTPQMDDNDKSGTSITRAKSMGFLIDVGKDDDRREKAHMEASVQLRPTPRSSRNRPVSSIFPVNPSKTEAPVPAPRWAVRRPLSTDLTSKFESVGLSLYQISPKEKPNDQVKENTRDGKLLAQRREQEQTTRTRLLKITDDSSDQSNKITDQGPEEDKQLVDIKSRISLLLDSSPGAGSTIQASDTQTSAEMETTVGVKQLIKQLTVETTPSQCPVMKPALKPRPLPFDLTKKFSSERSSDPFSLTEAADRYDIINDVQRRDEESGITAKAQKPSLDCKDSHYLSQEHSGKDNAAVQTMQASLFDYFVEKQSVTVKDNAEDSNRSLSSKRGDGDDERTLFTATNKEHMFPSGPLQFLHAFETVQLVEENRTSVALAQLENKAMKIQSKGNRSLTDKMSGQMPEQQPRFLRVGALPKWTISGLDQNASIEKLMLNESQKETPMVLEKDGDLSEHGDITAAPKRLKMLPDEETAKPRPTYFALTGQIQEPSSLRDVGIDMTVPISRVPGKSFPPRRNPSLEEAFDKAFRVRAEEMTSSHLSARDKREREDFERIRQMALEKEMLRIKDLDKEKEREREMEHRLVLNELAKKERIEAEKKRDLLKKTERHLIKMKELEKEKKRQFEIEKQSHLEFARMKEMEMQREVERERQKVFEKQKKEHGRQKQTELEKQKVMEMQKQIELEKQRLQELEKQKEVERERELKCREAERMQEKEKQRQKEEEMQKELDKERQLLEIQKEKQKMEEIERIKEQERQQFLEFKKQKQAGKERQKLIEYQKKRQREKKEREETEKIRQMALEQEMLRMSELDKERERQRLMEMEQHKEMEKKKQRLEQERQQLFELQQKHREKERQLEKERLREKQDTEKIRQMALEHEILRIKELEKEMELQRQLERQCQNDNEKERQRDLEQQRQRDLEQQRHLEQQRKRDLEQQRQRDLEQQRKRDLEQQRQRDLEQQSQRDLEQQRPRDLEQQRPRDLEQQRPRDLEQQRQRDLERERQRQLDFERQEMENQRLRQKEQQREKQRFEDLEMLKDLEKRQLMEFEKQKQVDRDRQRILDLENNRLKEKMVREEADKMRQIAKQQEAERHRLKEKQRKEEQERIKTALLRPQVLDIDSVLRSDLMSKTTSTHSDPTSRWRDPYKPPILDIDSFSSPSQHSPSQELFTVPSVQGFDTEFGAWLQPSPEKDVPSQASGGVSSPMWTSAPQDPWELQPVGMSVDKPILEPKKHANNVGLEQLLLRQDDWLRHPQRLQDNPSQLAFFLGAEAKSAHPSGGPSISTSPEQIWLPHELQHRDSKINTQSPRRSQGSQELNRMRSRSISRRSAPPETFTDGNLSRVRSRSAHREHERHSSQKQSGEEETAGGESDSHYGTWETGLRTDSSSLTPATSGDADECNPPPALLFPDTPTALLDTSALRSRAQLGKKRAPRTRPSRAARQTDAEGGSPDDWLYRDSTETTFENKEDNQDNEEQERGADHMTSLTSQRVALFPGVDPLALKVELKKINDSDNQVGGDSCSSSIKSSYIPRGARMMPPPGRKESGAEDSPPWLKELKSKKRLSQYENE